MAPLGEKSSMTSASSGGNVQVRIPTFAHARSSGMKSSMGAATKSLNSRIS